MRVALLLLGLFACAYTSPVGVEKDQPRPTDGLPEDGGSSGAGEGAGHSHGAKTPRPLDPEERVKVPRYPRMVMPGQVAKDLTTTVFVGLGTKKSAASEATAVIEGLTAEQGQIVLDLPKLTDGARAWSIDVILSAPDFRIVGDDFQTIQLPLEGSSTMARYEVVLENVPASKQATVQAFLFHEGAFMGQIGRTVDAFDRLPTASPPVEETTTASGAAVSKNDSHELHLIALDGERALVVVGEPGKIAAHSVVDFDRAALPGFLRPKFGAIRSRGLETFGQADPVGMDMVRGLGSQLWELTPEPIRGHLLSIYGDASIDSLRIYTNVPDFPWELLRPATADGTKLAPLGSRFRLGRWHLRMGMTGLTVPPERVKYQELVAMMPTYEGEEALPALKRELTALEAVRGFRRVAGRASEVASVVRNPPNGVLHFAGHGSATRSSGASTQYAMRLEDGAFDTLAFLGIEDKRLRERETVVFFNACELGQADATASIVEGWAPAMLDAGASGYIGALWPVGDDEAAAFAEAFYAELEASITATGEAVITDVLRCLRQRGAARKDPTWQAYLFYGDPDTSLVRADVTPTGTPWTCTVD